MYGAWGPFLFCALRTPVRLQNMRQNGEQMSAMQEEEGAPYENIRMMTIQCLKQCCMCQTCALFCSKSHPRSKHLKGDCGKAPALAARRDCGACNIPISKFRTCWRRHQKFCQRRLMHLRKASRQSLSPYPLYIIINSFIIETIDSSSASLVRTLRRWHKQSSSPGPTTV